MRKSCVAVLAATVSCVLLLAGAAGTASAQEPIDMAKTVPISGEAKNGKKFTGTYTINRFVAEGDDVFAVGKLRGTLKGRQVTRRGVRIPVSNFDRASLAQTSQMACHVLTLTLGPLDLNLLGLRIQLNQINLRITAIPSGQPGGGLLGDLLCGLSNLLNPAAQNPIGALLAQILNALLALLPQGAGTAGIPR